MLTNPTSSDPLTEFKFFQRFHFFYYSRKDDQVLFLLRQKKTGLFSEIRGRLEAHDPAILFSAGRKIMEVSSGLLTQQNLKVFAESSGDEEVTRDMLQLCKPKQSMPAILNSKLYQKFIEETFEAMQPYQEAESNDAYFFVEIPYVNLDKLCSFANECNINLNLKYMTRDQIIAADASEHIHPSMNRLFNAELNSHVEKYIERQEPVEIKGHYAVVCILTTPTNYRTMGLIGSYYKKHGEQWKFYRFPLEEPSVEELSQLDGLLIPGATVCAADKSLVWREKLLKLIRVVYEDYPHCKILGTCFGIQIVSEALGGRCERMKEFIRGSTKIAVAEEFWELPYMKDLGFEPVKELVVSKSHFDSVVQVPEGVTVYASSEACPVEIMGVGDRLLAFQGHPEINEAWTACLIYQGNNEKMNFNVYYQETMKKYFQEKLRHEMWLRIVSAFFKRKEKPVVTEEKAATSLILDA